MTGFKPFRGCILCAVHDSSHCPRLALLWLRFGLRPPLKYPLRFRMPTLLAIVLLESGLASDV